MARNSEKTNKMLDFLLQYFKGDGFSPKILGTMFYRTLSGNLLGSLVEDTTPQLGGNLDLNGSNLTGTGDITTTGDITNTGDINNTGDIYLPGLHQEPNLSGCSFYGGLYGGQDRNGKNVAAGEIHFIPVIIPSPVTVSGIHIHIDTGEGSAVNARMGLYNNSSSGMFPTTKIDEVVEFSIENAAHINSDFVGGDITLTPGIYWLGLCHDGTTTVVFEQTNTPGVMIGATEYGNRTVVVNMVNISHTYGTLPSTLGTVAAEVNTHPLRMFLVLA